MAQQENLVTGGGASSKEKIQRLIDESKNSLALEQQKALSHLLLNKKAPVSGG